MTTNKPSGDDSRQNAIRKPSRQQTVIDDEEHVAKRSKLSGELMDQERNPEAMPSKGAGKEHKDNEADRKKPDHERGGFNPQPAKSTTRPTTRAR